MDQLRNKRTKIKKRKKKMERCEVYKGKAYNQKEDTGMERNEERKRRRL